jgi:hypothetical protein
MVHTEGPMPYMRVHLPADLYERMKTRGLPASELLEKAVRAELSRQEVLAETDRYVADLVAEVGSPTAAQRTRAAAVTRRLARRSARRVNSSCWSCRAESSAQGSA